MIETDNYKKLINLLDKNDVEYKLFSHREALSWEELAAVQRESGFSGTEMKCMVLSADGELLVYVTLQGKRLNFDAIRNKLEAKKVRLSTPEELKDHFGAKPGCAYPFGFDAKFKIFIDPDIYSEDWLLFSPVLPTQTVQAKGSDLKRVFSSLENKVEEAGDFNL